MNNELYNNFIDDIQQKINHINHSLYNNIKQTKIYSNSYNPKHHKDDTMQLNNLLWKQKTIEYRKLQKKINSNKNYKEETFNTNRSNH